MEPDDLPSLLSRVVTTTEAVTFAARFGVSGEEMRELRIPYDRAYSDFAAQFQRVTVRVVTAGYRIDVAEDAYATAFSEIFESIRRGTFRPTTRSQCWAYLVRAALNNAYDASRRSRRGCSLPDGLADRRAAAPEAATESSESVRRIDEAVRSLPMREQQIILMNSEEMKTRDIAFALGLSEDNVRKILQRGRAHLHETLRRQEIIPAAAEVT